MQGQGTGNWNKFLKNTQKLYSFPAFDSAPFGAVPIASAAKFNVAPWENAKIFTT